MADSSFDVVSKVDRQEVDNALKQAAKELAQRFDFRGTGTGIDWSGKEAITIESETEERAKAAVEVFKEKLVKRSVSLKAVELEPGNESGLQAAHRARFHVLPALPHQAAPRLRELRRPGQSALGRLPALWSLGRAFSPPSA